MKISYLLLTPIILSILSGFVLLCIPKFKERKSLLTYVTITFAGAAFFSIATIFGPDRSLHLFQLTDKISIYFKIDNTGKIFALLTTVLWVLTGLFSFEYMRKEKNEKRFYGFYLILFGILLGVNFAGNLVTLYLFFELVTLLSAPLVIHILSKESIMATLKYLFYSLAGAYMALFGVFFLYKYSDTLEFIPGGSLSNVLVSGNEGIILIAVFSMLIGFGVKAGMFPMHAWLPTAHPVAPAPASAFLSAIIVKVGVLAIIRVVFFVVGAEFLRGTWVQYAWLTLTIVTIFMGSMLAYRENNLKKRLAYSTISQVSYILFGLALLNPEGFVGGILQVVFHAIIKTMLFLSAGAIIYKTGRKKVSELAGIGKEMPITIWCFTIASLGLIGIPPTAGFIGKWYLAIGSLGSGIQNFSWIGVVVLLISALLTAGYLLPITINGFFPGKENSQAITEKKEPNGWMLVPLIVMAIAVVMLGVFPNKLTELITTISATIM